MKHLKIILLYLLLLPIMVKADVGAPSFTEYSIRIKNPDGAVIYKFKEGKIIPDNKKQCEYDKIIEGVNFEQEFDGEVYIDTVEGLIKSSDVEIYGKFNLNDLKKEEKIKSYVYKEGAYLYNGPSKVYGKVENEIMLPVGTTIETNYYDEMFAYVSYNGVKGWVYICQPYEVEGACPYKDGSSLADIESGEVVSSIDNAKIYKDLSEKEVLTTLPKFEKLKYNYTYYYSHFAKAYYVSYKGFNGWIKDTAKECDDCTLYTHLKKYDVCSSMQYEECSNVVATIPKNTFVKIKYVAHNYDSWYYVSYNGKSGWVYQEAHDDIEVHNVYKYENQDVYYLKKEAKLYSDIYGKETDNIVESGKVIADFYVYDKDNYNSDNIWLHITEGKNKGWIKTKEDNVSREGIDVEPEPIIEPEKKEDIKNKDININIPFKDIVVYSVLGAVALSVAIIVTIKLVNKKKEDKTIPDNKE